MKNFGIRDWPWVAWIILIGTVIPLAYLEVAAGKWAEGSTGYIAINENLKFVAWLWTAVLGLLLATMLLSTGTKCWNLPPGVWKPWLLLLLACVGSNFYSLDKERGWLTLLEAYVLPMLVMLTIAGRQWNTKAGVFAITGWIPACTVAGWAGLVQFQDHWSSNIPEIQDIYDWARDLPHYAQIGATFYSQNLAAEYLVVVLPAFAVLAGILILRWRPEHAYLIVPLAIAGAVCVQYLVISKGRAAWVGLAAGCLVGFGMWQAVCSTLATNPEVKRLAKWGYIGTGGFLLALYLAIQLSPVWATGFGDEPPGPNKPLQPDRFVEEFRSIFNKDSNGRTDIWEDTIEMANQETLLFGLGPGQFRIHFPKHIGKSQAMFDESVSGPVFKQTRRAHNDYLQLWVETGILGVFAYFWLVGRAALGAYRSLFARVSSGDWAGSVVTLGLVTAFAIYSATMAFDFPARMPGTLSLGWILLGLLLGMEQRDREAKELPAPWRPCLLVAGITFCLVCVQTGKRLLVGDFYRIQGIHAHQRGETDNALMWTSKALEYLPWDEDAWFLAYHLHRKKMDMESALHVVQSHLRRNPWYYPSMRNEMDCLEQLGEFAEARKSARRILTAFPRHPNAAWFRQYIGEE